MTDETILLVETASMLEKDVLSRQLGDPLQPRLMRRLATLWRVIADKLEAEEKLEEAPAPESHKESNDE